MNAAKNLPAVLPVHLAAVVVELSVGAASKSGDPPASRVALFGCLAMSAMHGNDSLPEKFEILS